MGVTTTVAGLTMTVILTLSAIMGILLATNGKNCEIPITASSILILILCTVFEWVNPWLTVIFSLAMSLGIGWYLSKTGRGAEA